MGGGEGETVQKRPWGCLTGGLVRGQWSASLLTLLMLSSRPSEEEQTTNRRHQIPPLLLSPTRPTSSERNNRRPPSLFKILLITLQKADDCFLEKVVRYPSISTISIKSCRCSHKRNSYRIVVQSIS